jgi:signal transduction histidine kinase/ActR/RegA family two-component response regulator
MSDNRNPDPVPYPQDDVTAPHAWSAEWLERLAAVPWHDMDFREAMRSILSFLTAIHYSSWGVLWLQHEEQVRVWGPGGLETTLKPGDAFLAHLELSTHSGDGEPVLLTRNDPGWPRPPIDVAWETGLQNVQSVWVVPIPVPEPGWGVLLVAGIQQQDSRPVIALTRLLARQVQTVMVRETLCRRSEKLSADLERTHSKLVELAKWASVGQTANTIAHQLNNSLTTVLGYSELLLQTGGRPAEDEKYLKRVFTEAQRMSYVLENMLIFARRSRGGRDLVDVNDLLRETVALLGYELEKDSVSVELQLASDLPLIMADPFQVQQIFLNIIRNARQALKGCQRAGTLVIRTEHALDSQDHILVEFADDGPGIPVDFLEMIFEPFFTTHEIEHGLGLGLTMCRNLAREQGGHIYARSEHGQGATFVVDLPRSRPAAVTQLQVMAPHPHTAPIRVLIVEDEEEVALLLSRLLSVKNCQPEVVSSAEEGLERLAQEEYDLVLSDLAMSGIGGKGLYEHLKSTNSPLLSRLVFFTGDSVSPEAAALLEESGAPLFQKPFEIVELERAVEQALAHPKA